MSNASAYAQRLYEVAASLRGRNTGDDRDSAIDCENAARELSRLHALINNPHTADFVEAVKSEAAHQRERWGVDHDAGKEDSDWFWLIGYLAGKAIRPDATPEKRLHHIITTAAACLNWHAARAGIDTRMRPGIAPPDETNGERNG